MTKKTPFRFSLAAAPVALALVLVGTVGCTEDERVAQHEATITELRSQVTELETAKIELSKQIDRNSRIMRGFTDDIVSLREMMNERGGISSTLADTGDGATEGAAAAAGGEAGEGLVAGLDGSGDDIVEALQTDDGQKVLEKAMDKLRQKRDSERMDRMVQGMVDRFAEKANLSADQKERMTGIMSGSMQQIRDVWSSMRTARDLSPEAMAQLREDNMAKMGEITSATNEEVKLVLSTDQFLIYEEETARMRGFGGGGGRRGGGGGR